MLHNATQNQFNKAEYRTLPAPLAPSQEAFGGVDGGVSGVRRPVQEEGLAGPRLSGYEVKTLL